MTTGRRSAAPWVVSLGAIRALALAALLPGLLLLWSEAGPVAALRDVVFDAYQRLHPRPYRPAPVRVVDIDDQSLARLGQWPWPRTRLAALVQRLGELGAAVVALDVVFPESDRLSPSALARSWPELFASVPASALRDFDREFASTLARWPVVGGIALTTGGPGELPTVHATFAEVGPDPRPALPAFDSAVVNLPVLNGSLAGTGSFSVPLGRDATLRRLPLLQRVGDTLVPALALEALRVALAERTIAVRSSEGPGGRPEVRELRVGDLRIPVTAAAELWLHSSRPEEQRRIPAWRILEAGASELEALSSAVAGQVVLVGASATALGDFVPTPLGPSEAAVLIHAQALEQMALGWFLSRPDWAPWLELAALLALGYCAVWLMPGAGVLSALATAGLLGGALLLGSWLAFVRLQLLLDPLAPLALSLPALLIAGLGRYLRTERERAQVRRAFGQFLAPDLVRALARDPSRLRLGGESREMTFLFSDIAGFTSLSEGLPAERLVALVNAYLDGACQLAIAHGGTIDKIVGDAIHVFFNAPLDQPDHSQRAVAFALALDAFGRDFAAEQQRAGLAMGLTRIGVNTGTAVVGNFGGAARFDYTAHGDAVNTAARLESANKTLGTTVCVAESTVARAPGQAFRPAGRLRLRGKSRPVQVYQPLSGSGQAPAAEYLRAYRALEAGEAQAEALFVGLLARHPGDPLVKLFAERARAGGGGVELSVES